MLFIGIETNPDKTYTVAQMDENRNILYLSPFWREGLLWFLDHKNINIVAVNLPSWYKTNQQKNALEVIRTLTDTFEFHEAGEETEKEKVVIKTDTDLFFSQLVKKDLLPITTPEGLEQRIYNLPKAGIIVQPEMFSKERKQIQRELGAIASAFAAYSYYHGTYDIVEREEDKLYIPKYSFVPKEKRIISRLY